MSERPRVTVEHSTGERSQPMGFGAPTDTDAPHVAITVTFPLHGHDAALGALSEAIDHVRSQITQEDQ